MTILLKLCNFIIFRLWSLARSAILLALWGASVSVKIGAPFIPFPVRLHFHCSTCWSPSILFRFFLVNPQLVRFPHTARYTTQRNCHIGAMHIGSRKTYHLSTEYCSPCTYCHVAHQSPNFISQSMCAEESLNYTGTRKVDSVFMKHSAYWLRSFLVEQTSLPLVIMVGTRTKSRDAVFQSRPVCFFCRDQEKKKTVPSMPYQQHKLRTWLKQYL